MSGEVFHERLWPVLAVLAGLVLGAGGLEAAARSRSAPPLVIEIGPESVEGSGDESGAEVDLAAEDAKPVSPEHEKARVAARRGEFAAAFALFEELVRAKPTSGVLRGDYGFWLLTADRPADARKTLEDAARLLPDDARIAYLEGAASADLGERVRAEEAFRRAIALRPGYTSARIALASSLVRRRQPKQALEVLKPITATGSNLDRARVLVLRGRANLMIGRGDQAEQDFSRAVEWAPARALTRVAIARAWLDAGGDAGTNRALELSGEAVKVAPDLPVVHRVLGTALERAHRDREAEAAYERAIALDPGSRFVRRRLVRLALERGDFRRARSHLEPLLQAAPDVPEHQFLAALVAARDGQPDEAREHYQRAIEKAGGTYPEAYFNLAGLEKNAGSLDRAVTAYEKAIEQRPDYLAAFNNLGLALAAANRPDDARQRFERAIEIDAAYAPAWLNLGRLYAKGARYDQALKSLRRAAELRPNDANTRLELGDTLARAGRLEEASAVLGQLVESQPRSVKGWCQLAGVYELRGRSDDAVLAYRRALEIDPEHVDALRGFAALAARSGRRQESRTAYGTLLDLVPGDDAARSELARLETD